MTRRADQPADLLSAALLDPALFARLGGVNLRAYQQTVLRAVCRAALAADGATLVVMFPRQSGKNELQAHIEAYLLQLRRYSGGEIVKVAPTWRPQALNSMRRLARVLEANPWTRGQWRKESGYIYRLGEARILFLSGAPEANIVGATASLLLEIDEAQDVTLAKYDRDILPMAASTNAARVLWGTAWTSRTLLARELAAAQELERAPGRPPIPTAFVLTADDVIREVPAYARHVAAQARRLGRNHPFVRTQYYSEAVDGQGGLFPAERVARMFPYGAPPGLEIAGLPPAPAQPRDAPRPARLAFAMLVDVGGIASEGADADGDPADDSRGAAGGGGRRDSTALTVVAADLDGLADPLLRAPRYRPVWRQTWTGTAHADLYPALLAAARAWGAAHLVIDATGVGAGLASFLERALPGRVTPFVFSSASKSRLGWDFIALVDAGRWVEWAPGEPPAPPAGGGGLPTGAARQPEQERLRGLFVTQLSLCAYEILPGAGQTLRWGVPDGTRDPLSRALAHDDLLLSAALAAALDKVDWQTPARLPGLGIVPGRDPLDESRAY